MQDTLIIYDAPLRAGAFLIVFAMVAIWEILAPRRALVAARSKRWLANLGRALRRQFGQYEEIGVEHV